MRSSLHDFITKISVIYFILLFVFLLAMGTFACKISEFSCRASTICLPLDKYCDGKDDCGDASDEPKFCTVCNRTYYGDVGRTYTLRVPPPQWNRLPFLCHITFTASGQDQGDIVQILFDGFSVGRFDEGLLDTDSDSLDSSVMSVSQLPGCPEGFMQLSELGRPFTGGSWCGAATGPQLYYSETSTVTASVKVFHAPMQAATPFEFRIRYKFISQSDAIVRYGRPNELLELGRVTPGTYCTRQFEECYRKKCRLQSPNYPGMYPRNVTCYWTIRQKAVPTCKHAMIGVRQENSHKSLVKRSVASLNKTSRSVRAWADCTGERDHLIFYDGSSTNDPVLAKYCGGDWLPRVVSRGSEMLVAFHSSPFSAPLQSDIPNRGFELDVDILFADSDSYDFAAGNKGICEFHINSSNPDDVLLSRRGRMGKILSPIHTLPPNTTCTYYFHGYPHDLIWIAFTRYNLQILQHAIHDNNTLGRTGELPPWIARLRIWDSTEKLKSLKSTLQTINNSSYNNYYYSPQNPMYGKNIKVNIDNVWNPVDTYIYGPTPNTIFNKPQQSDQKIINLLSTKYNKNAHKDSFNYVTNLKEEKFERLRNKESTTQQSAVTTTAGGDASAAAISSTKLSKSTSRKLITELFDNDTPMLCDLGLLEDGGRKMRACTPLESYVSTGNDMKIEFHTHTGTALYPASFSINYEFVDTDLGGDLWTKQIDDDDDEPPLPPLCSRVFRKRRGNFQSPRNVFLHGRGGAKNLTCLYRFEADVGERVRIVLHNVSFGDSASCTTESEYHTGRPKCSYIDGDSTDPRISELKILDVIHTDVKIPIACFCDNTSSLYNVPITVQSTSKTMELIFIVTKLNISEDFADIYFYASYEYIKIPDCNKKLHLKGSGGEEEMSYPMKPYHIGCDGSPLYVEAQQSDRSLFLLTWGVFLPSEPTIDDMYRCNTKNRLLIYSGRPMKILRIICPTHQGPRRSALHIFSEDWANLQPQIFFTKPASFVLEPIFKEPGNLVLQWLEIKRTKASLLQQLDKHTNYTFNETLGEFGFITKEPECEYKCPELNACIASNLWCDGRPNCPSGHDESEEECGTTRKLLELPGSVYAALGFLAAAITVCIIFCVCGIVRKRKKLLTSKSSNGINGTFNNCRKDSKKESLFIDTGS